VVGKFCQICPVTITSVGSGKIAVLGTEYGTFSYEITTKVVDGRPIIWVAGIPVTIDPGTTTGETQVSGTTTVDGTQYDQISKLGVYVKRAV